MGKGTTFTIVLPSIARPAATVEPKPAESLREVQPRRILLVEDHTDTARVIAQLLRRDGHDVKVAADLASARDVFAAYECDLVISDIGLPDGSGVELVADFRQQRPDVPAICMSGYGAEQDVRASSSAGTICHLTKPVTIQRLRQAIAQAAGEPPAQ
jgi:DNA-binding NtrC family response regulator